MRAVIAAPLASSLFYHLASAAENDQTVAGRPTTQTFPVGQFLVDVSTRDIRVRHAGDPTRSLWQSVPGQPLIESAVGEATFREHGDPLGYFDVTDDISSMSSFRSFDSVEVPDALSIKVTGRLAASSQSMQFSLIFVAVSANQLQFTLDVASGNASPCNRIFLKYASSPDEAFFGFGQQLTDFNQKGNVIPIIVQEHGIGRGLPVFTQLVDLFGDGAGAIPI